MAGDGQHVDDIPAHAFRQRLAVGLLRGQAVQLLVGLTARGHGGPDQCAFFLVWHIFPPAFWISVWWSQYVSSQPRPRCKAVLSERGAFDCPLSGSPDL